MREIYKKKRSLGLLVLLTMLVQIFVPFLETGKVYANSIDGDIDLDLQIVGGVKEEYRPGDIINVEGKWELPDDSPGSEYKDGDKFSISIPDGLTASFGKIKLGDMAEGVVVGDKVVFTFNENVEQLMNRKGGFNLIFTVDTPDEYGEKKIDLDFKDDKGSVIKDYQIKVNHSKGVVVEGSDETFIKESYPGVHDEVKWYIRINQSGKLKGNFTLKDNIVGENHILIKDSFEVLRGNLPYNQNESPVKIDTIEPTVSDDLRSFEVEFELDDKYWYTVQYKTKYVGDYFIDVKSDDYDAGILKLKNRAYLEDEKNDVYYPDGNDGSKDIEGNFNLGGWAEGDGGYGKLSIIKEDLATRKRLKGARFKVQEIKTGKEYTVETDDNGVANVINTAPDWLTGGKYIIKEVTAPEGYKLNSEEIIVNIGSSNNEEIVITNEAILDININKEWLDYKGDKIPPQEDIAVQLLANGSPVRQSVLTKDMDKDLIFKNLPKFDESGEEIKYSVKEYIEVDGGLKEVTIKENNGTGYTSAIDGSAEEGFTITNTKEPEKLSISVNKVWKDSSENELKDTSNLPEVTVELLADGEKVEGIDPLNLKSGNGWKGEFKDLLKFDESGEEIEYSVKEVEVEGYTANITGNAKEGFTITNTKEPEKLSISVNKVWKDSSENELKDTSNLPEVTVELLADGEKVEGIDPLNLKSGNGWKGEFKDLLKFDESGEEIEYSVKEIEVEGYTANITGNAKEGFTITNTKEPETTSVSVNKVWEGTALDNVTVKLLANGEEVDEVILSEGNNWTHTFEKFDKFNDEKEIEYSIKEYIKVDGGLKEVTAEKNNGTGYISEIKDTKEGFTITNTEEPENISVSVSKVWKGEALESVTVKLLADGKEVDEVILSEGNNWTHTFEKLDKFNDEKEIEYSIKEYIKVDGGLKEVTTEENNGTGYISEIKDTKEGFTITNTEIEEPNPKPETTSVSVNKVWEGEALESVKVKLLADGKEVDEVILSEGNNWTHTFEEIDKFNDESGKEIVYTVKEEVPEGYTAKITGNAKDGFTITNTKDPEPVEPEDPPKPDKPIEPEPAPETVSLTVKKAWIGEPTERVLVQLVANGQGLEVVELRESNNWKHVFINLVKYNSDGSEIEYSVVEIDVPDGYTEEYSRPEEDTILITNIKDEEPEEPEPIIPEPEEPEEPETPEPEEPEEPENPEPVEPEEPENPEPVEPEEPENPDEDGDGSKNPNKPGDEEPEEDVDGVIVEKPEDPEEDGSGSKNPNKPGDKEETVTDASQETKLPKTGSNSLDYYLLGLLLLLIGLLLKKRERVAN